MKVGKKAYPFEMTAIVHEEGIPKNVSLEDYKGTWFILFFYLHDFSIECPTEIRSLNHRLRI